MNIIQKLSTGLFATIICMGICMGASAADTAPKLTEKQRAALGICNIATNGVYSIAHMHQTNVSQNDARQEVKRFSDALVRDFGDDEITALIRDFWQQGLTEIYKFDIKPTDEQKIAFAESAAYEAHTVCLDGILDDADKAALIR